MKNEKIFLVVVILLVFAAIVLLPVAAKNSTGSEKPNRLFVSYGGDPSIETVQNGDGSISVFMNMPIIANDSEIPQPGEFTPMPPIPTAAPINSPINPYPTPDNCDFDPSPCWH